VTTEDFSVTCQVCSKEVNNFTQSIKFIMTDSAAVQEAETIYLSCGCVVDFPDWHIDINTGMCEIIDFAGTLFIKFFDEEMIVEEDWS